MKRLFKLLIKEFSRPLVATFFIALFILILQFLWKQIDELAGKGLDSEVIAELLLYAAAGLVPLALPLAVLLSSIMTFGNLGENFELTAIKSSGISLQQFMKPLIVLVTALGISAFFYANHVIPYANLKAMSLLYDIKKQREELQIREGVFYNDIEGYSIKVGEKNPKTNLMKDIMIYNHDENQGNAEVTVADSGYIKMTSDETKLLVILYKGQTYKEMEESKKNRAKRAEKKYPHQVRKFEKETLLMDISGFSFKRTDEDLFKGNYQMLKIRQLKEKKDSLERAYNTKALELADKLKKNLYIERIRKSGPNQNKVTQNSQSPKETRTPPRQPHPSGQKKQVRAADTSLQDSSSNPLNDSVINTLKDSSGMKPLKFDFAGFYNRLDPDDKMAVVRNALTHARRNSKSISNSKRIFEHRQKNIFKHQIHWHEKFTLSFACIIFFFIGAPLGSIIRQGGLGTPLVISVILFIIYYIISITGENFVEKGVLPATVGMWLSSIIFLPIGIFLTYKATNDSVILNSDTYVKMIRKILRIKTSRKRQRAGFNR